MNARSMLARLVRFGAVIIGSVAALSFLCLGFQASAATCTFASAGTSDFNTAGNWDCGFVPGATSTAIIPVATSTALSAPVTVGALTINSNATFTTPGFDFTSLGNVSSSGAYIVNTSANTSTIGGNLIFSSGFTFTAGTGTVLFATSTVVSTCSSSSFHCITAPSAVTFNNLTVSTSNNGLYLSDNVLFSISGNLIIYSGQFTVASKADVTVAGKTQIEPSIGASSASLLVANSDCIFTANGTTTVIGPGSIISTNAPGANPVYIFNGDVTSSGSIGMSGNKAPTYTFAKAFTNTGTFVSGSSTAIFSGSINQTIPSGITFWNLTASSTATITLSGNTTASHAFINRSGSTFAVGTNRFAVLGTYSNAGTVTENTASGGVIIHAAESVLVTDSSGSEVSSISTAGSLYVTVRDNDKNLLSDTIETIPVTLTTNSAAGSDSETITLTETGAATGIFRNTSAINVVNSSFVSTGNGQIELSASGVGTGNYTDAQDSTDTGSDTVTLTYVAASSGGSSGGGGVGSSGSGSLPPIQPQFQTNVPNLAKLPVPIHTLVKLPDDGKANTQYDSAVYYTGADGKRHAFPNANVYFTWYKDFSGVQVVSQDQLATIPLGSNVTYKPGVKMVKFTTDPKVYAVAKGGILRWIKTETAAIALYGDLWNKNIDDISDAFYANYSFGQDVTGLSDFDPVKIQASVTYPSDSLQK